MNFKGIQVYGFKSFADRLDLTFDGGFTGIVGPNGCGKSNVADAIRWVLGEQAPRALRGSCMQDVIFNGTDKRGSLSYCEVSLVFDNSKKMFNVNFDEVVISRKLYRSGESEYLINDVTCRLKDITDMLRDTGLGRDGLAIIGQGRVEDILKDKPADRRKVFEEAAGIARLKSKKRESELRLARHRMNLERINYILIELERQLGPLKKQAEDAKKYIDLSDQLKYQEVNYYLYRYETANEQKADINNKIKIIDSEIEELRKNLDKASEDYSSKMSDIGSYDEQLEELKNEQTRLLVDVEKLAGDGKVLSERINNDKASVKDIENAITSNKDKIDNIAQMLSQAVTSREQTLREIDTLNKQLDDVTDKYLTIVEEIQSGESKLELTNLDIFSSLDKLTDIKSTMSKLITEKDNLENQLAELNEEQSISIERLNNSEQSNEKYKSDIELIDSDIEKLRASIAKLRGEYNDSRSKLNEYNHKLVEINSRKSALETRNKMMTNIKNSYENFQMSVRRVMQDSVNDRQLANCIEGVVAELIKVPAEYEVAIETVLAGGLQNIVTKTQEDAAYVIDYLKRNNYGRITFLPMNSFKSRFLDPIYKSALSEKGVIGVASDVVKCDVKYRGIIEGLLGSTILVSDIQTAIKLSQRYRNGFRIVTTEGEVLSTTGSMAGGSRKSDRADFLSKEREIEDNKKLLVEAAKQYSIIQEDQKKFAARLEKILDEIQEEDEKIQKKEVNKASLSEKIIIAAKLYDDTLVNINLRKSKIDSISNRVNEIQEQIKYIEKMESDAQNERTSQGKAVQESKSLYDKKKASRDQLAARQSELKVLIKEKESVVKSYEADMSRFKEEGVLAERTLNDLATKKDILVAKLENSEKELHKILLENSDNEEIIIIKDKIDKITKSKRSLQDQLFELDFAKAELNSKINEVSGRQIREESRLAKIDSDLSNMEESIWEQYQLNYELALAIRDIDYDCSKASSEISKLKKSINALGVVNINAIEDYKEVGARYEDLNSQKIDLTKAEEDLIEIIKELTDEMVTKFKTEFDKINENFKHVFKELFGGGRAELILEENEEDPLEAGITIKAEPPGKKMQNIGLLSGGERALIAIGILFAILKTKPMPFCVLDEIEAALDDSNVKVFASYLRKFSRETQFIVITHRKPTMELADSLYGVTMEEKGVSKMVSVKLSEAIRTALMAKKMENAG